MVESVGFTKGFASIRKMNIFVKQPNVRQHVCQMCPGSIIMETLVQREDWGAASPIRANVGPRWGLELSMAQ